jgi:hypothetical protein
MSAAPTAQRVERGALAPGAVEVRVTQLRAGDVVFDVQGLSHRLMSVRPGSAATVWIQRDDLNYVEHLSGGIIVLASTRRGRRAPDR